MACSVADTRVLVSRCTESSIVVVDKKSTRVFVGVIAYYCCIYQYAITAEGRVGVKHAAAASRPIY